MRTYTTLGCVLRDGRGGRVHWEPTARVRSSNPALLHSWQTLNSFTFPGSLRTLVHYQSGALAKKVVFHHPEARRKCFIRPFLVFTLGRVVVLLIWTHLNQWHTMLTPPKGTGAFRHTGGPYATLCDDCVHWDNFVFENLARIGASFCHVCSSGLEGSLGLSFGQKTSNGTDCRTWQGVNIGRQRHVSAIMCRRRIRQAPTQKLLLIWENWRRIRKEERKVTEPNRNGH